MRVISALWGILSHPILGSTVGGWLIFLTFVAFLIWCGIDTWDNPTCRLDYNDAEYTCP